MAQEELHQEIYLHILLQEKILHRELAANGGGWEKDREGKKKKKKEKKIGGSPQKLVLILGRMNTWV